MKFKSEYLSDFIVKYFSEINVKNVCGELWKEKQRRKQLKWNYGFQGM